MLFRSAQRLAVAAADAGGLIFGPLPRTGINSDNWRENRCIGDIPARIGDGAAAIESERLPGPRIAGSVGIDPGNAFIGIAFRGGVSPVPFIIAPL